MRISSIEEFPRELVPVEIPPHTVMLRGIGWDSNVYLVKNGSEVLIVDTGTGINWHVYTEIWEREGYLNGVKRIVIFNTHEHFDHIGGNVALKRWLEGKGMEVPFAAHEVTAKTLERGDDYIILAYSYGMKFEPQKVDIRLKDGDELRIGSLRLELIHTPGHTAGSSCLYLDDEVKIMFTGDTLFNGTVGRTDLPTGNGWKLQESLERLLEYEVEFGLPGHGWVVKDWKGNINEVLGWL
ncbi:MBL fold metallo-hydrolase [Thermococcus thioreducens]|uniref:Glyoxylase, beta-lactamase superfamily II n=1 Tax=Thermococcus thioreducens TaxID=277988 RepID=A0A0Q2QQL8_9EURY|nr:MBL fold metallo-hydrolase [Thermococcus thioreducens]ASJ12783.1 hydrolase [Thermococcus thioreducens]KQH82253.1 hydrolase [Thermococcus thioreducens]SEV85291.1 Glyoxylase, beta-lactamase superfamily II [Thermococcus thioreducens]